MRAGKILVVAAPIILWCTLSQLRAGTTAIDFSLEKESTTSAGVFSRDGKLLRTLWTLKKLAPGSHHDQWDGFDELGRNLPPGEYEVRVACSNATFTDVGTIGNSGVGSTMQSGTDDLITDRQTGDIYTANNWEEAGQDFRKMNAEGRHLMDAQFRVRNGTPNGWPIAVAVNDGILYCSVFTVHEPVAGQQTTLDGGAVIRKFTADTGEPLKFPTETGYIRLKEPDPQQKDIFDHQSVHSIAISGNTILAADRDTGIIWKFDKTSGKPIGTFKLDHPACLIADGADRLWIAYDRNKVAVTDLDGKALSNPAVNAGQIVCIRLDRDHRLWLADQDAGQIQVYKTDAQNNLTLEKSYGHKAQPGEFQPLSIGHIQSFDVMPDSGFVLAQTYGHGSVVTRFAPDEKVIWQQVGLEFCTNGCYDPAHPDLFISSLSNAYRLTDPRKGNWQFAGCLYQGPIKTDQSTGTPRIIDRDGHRYFFSLTGDLVKVFRFEGERLVPATMVGLTPRAWDEKLMGELPEKQKPTHFVWRDLNGDGQIQPDEITKVNDPKSQIASFSCEVDQQGNLIIPNHYNNGIDALPLSKFDEHGNPVYEWSQLREILPPDETLRGLRPQKACPLPGGGMYVLQQADPAFYPGSKTMTPWGNVSGLVWMGGWVFSKYDASGNRLFTIALPEECTGLDWVPNAARDHETGVIVGEYSAMRLFHFSPDGLMLQILSPAHKTGWLDHNGSLSVNRNPRDGLVDVFAEESLSNRISWYRMDDREVKTVKVAIRKDAAAGERYVDEKQLDDLVKQAHASQQSGNYSAAIDALHKAIDLAGEHEKALLHYRLGRAYQSDRQTDKAVDEYQNVFASPSWEPRQKLDLMVENANLLQQEKKYDEAAALMKRMMDLTDLPDPNYVPRAMWEIANIQLAAQKPDEAMQSLQKAAELCRSGKSIDPNLYRQVLVSTGDLLRRQKKFPQAIAEYEQSVKLPGVDDNSRMWGEGAVGDVYIEMNDLASARTHLSAAVDSYPGGDPQLRADLAIKEGDLELKAGDKQSAQRRYRQAREIPDARPDQKKSADQKLEQLAK